MHTYVLGVFTQHNVSTTDFQHVCHPQRGWVSDDIQDHCTSFVVGSLAGGLSQSVPQWPFGCTHCEQWFIAPYPLGCLGAYTQQSGNRQAKSTTPGNHLSTAIAVGCPSARREHVLLLGDVGNLLCLPSTCFKCPVAHRGAAHKFQAL